MTLFRPTRKHVPETDVPSNFKIPTLLDASNFFSRNIIDSLPTALRVFMKAPPWENCCMNCLLFSWAFFSLYFTWKTCLGAGITGTLAAENKK